MKVKLDDEILFEIDDRMVKLLAHDLLDPMEEIRRRLRWVIEHKCDQCFKRLNDEWLLPDSTGETKVSKAGLQSLPTSRRGIVDAIFSLPEYKNRADREKEAEEKLKNEKEE